MDSLVLDLQRLASESKEKLSDLLRKALVVATKLGLDDFRTWIECELKGYPAVEVPQYRVCRSSYHVRNPYHGLQPVIIPDAKLEKAFCEIRITESIESLQHVLDEEGKNGSVGFSIPPEHEVQLRRDADLPGMPLVRLVSTNNLSAILDTVRTTILEWALKLEAEGILGEGMSFSSEEKQKAESNPQINIANFQGILGNVTGGQVHQNTLVNIRQNDFKSLNKALSFFGISPEDITELHDAVKSEPRLKSDAKFGPKVGSWLGRVVQKVAEGGLKVGGSVTSSILTDAIKKYYGI
ncbi:MAG: hypothetical protein ACOX5J_08525 [Candidatus Hydrogenedentales bacterium]|jgi:hypothetical protein